MSASQPDTTASQPDTATPAADTAHHGGRPTSTLASRDAGGNQVRLLAALVGPDAAASVVAAQAEVGVKTNEVPMAAVVLSQIDLNNKIVTADALHTVKATANHIHEHGGEFVLPVKENRRALFDALDTLPWGQVPIGHTATGKGHGRITTRTIQVLPAPTTCRSRTSARCS
jgi:predicted transposase YbfD/YdcC